MTSAECRIHGAPLLVIKCRLSTGINRGDWGSLRREAVTNVTRSNLGAGARRADVRPVCRGDSVTGRRLRYAPWAVWLSKCQDRQFSTGSQRHLPRRAQRPGLRGRHTVQARPVCRSAGSGQLRPVRKCHAPRSAPGPVRLQREYVSAESVSIPRRHIRPRRAFHPKSRWHLPATTSDLAGSFLLRGAGNSHAHPNTHTDSHADADSNANSDQKANGYTNGYTNGHANSDPYADSHAFAHADANSTPTDTPVVATFAFSPPPTEPPTLTS